MPASDPTSPVIIIAAKAGAPDGLLELAAGLPPALPAPILLVRYPAPRRPDHQTDHQTVPGPLPVRPVQERQPLPRAPGTIYAVPSSRRALVRAAEIVLVDEPAPGSSAVLAPLLTSAAEVFGEHLFAVILGDAGADGASGAWAIKLAGGTVIAQDATAHGSGLLALVPNAVDLAAAPARIGPLLATLLADPVALADSVEQRLLDALLREIRTRHGLDFSAYKPTTLWRRLQQRIAATGAADLAGYTSFAAAHPEEYRRLADAFLITVTAFYRDPELFSYLRTDILPELIAEARGRDRELRLWSAGCATGEEAYTLALLVAEALGPELSDFTVRIFATDVDGRALAFARRGIYPAAAVAGLPPELVEHGLVRADGAYQVAPPVRGLVVFGTHDLVSQIPFPRIDLVLCRNVLIYFTPELRQRVHKAFAFALRDGGYLVLGRAEQALPAGAGFAPWQRRLRIYRRHGAPAPLPAAARLAPPGPAIRPVVLPTHAARPPARMGAASADLLHARDLPIGVVIINRRYDIRVINEQARRLLAIYGPAIGEDFLHLLPDVLYAGLRAAIDRTFAEGVATSTPDLALDDMPAAQRLLRITCQRQPAVADGEAEPMVVLIVSEVPAPALPAVTPEPPPAGGADEGARAREERIQQLLAANAELVEANLALRADFEELRAVNQQLQIQAEEGQTLAEEAETRNEELRATNEELESLNEALRSMIEDLAAQDHPEQSAGAPELLAGAPG